MDFSQNISFVRKCSNDEEEQKAAIFCKLFPLTLYFRWWWIILSMTESAHQPVQDFGRPIINSLVIKLRRSLSLRRSFIFRQVDG